MKNYLPSKQFIRTIAIALGLCVLFFIVGKVFNTKTVWQKEDTNSGVALASDGDFFGKDTDGDGLYDWEEALWKTDPNQIDSDDDGVDDKQYVESRRKEMDADESYKPDDGNQTEVFAKQLFTTASVLDQSGGFDQEGVEKFAEGVNQSFTSFHIENKYTLDDLKIRDVSAHTYYQNFSAVYLSLPGRDISELSVIARLFDNPDDQKALDDLGTINIMYTTFQDKLLNIETPHAVAGTHLSILNNLHKLSTVIAEARFIDSDPLKVATYLSKYESYSTDFSNDFKALKAYFMSNGLAD